MFTSIEQNTNAEKKTFKMKLHEACLRLSQLSKVNLRVPPNARMFEMLAKENSQPASQQPGCYEEIRAHHAVAVQGFQ